MSDLVERLRFVSNMIHLGERISWGQETTLMDEAAAELTRLHTDAEQAWALAYQRAANRIRIYLREQRLPLKERSPGAHLGMADAILALAPADALAEVQSLKAERDAAREALVTAGIALHVAKREATDAEAVAADSYKEGWWFAFRQWEQTGFVPNPDWKPIPPVEDNTP